MGYLLKKILVSLPPGPRPPIFIGVAEPLAVVSTSVSAWRVPSDLGEVSVRADRAAENRTAPDRRDRALRDFHCSDGAFIGYRPVQWCARSALPSRVSGRRTGRRRVRRDGLRHGRTACAEPPTPSGDAAGDRYVKL